jgi:transposase
VPWAEAKGRFTHEMESSLIALLQVCRTLAGAATFAGVTPDIMQGVMERAVKRGLERRQIGQLKRLGLDEKAIRKGHTYASILSNNDTGQILEVVEGRTTEDAVKLFQTVPKDQVSKVEAVAMDMWPAYIKAAAQCLPEADVVYDRFHVSKHLNEAVDKVRRQENRELSAAGDDTLKSTKYLWLWSRVDLRTEMGIKFRRCLNQDLRTGVAWTLKQTFQRFWKHQTWGGAFRFLDHWVAAARDCGLKPMLQVANMVDQHAEGLLNYIHHGITNARSEGLNSMIQNLKCMARGLPRFESLRIRIFFFLGQLNLLPA